MIVTATFRNEDEKLIAKWSFEYNDSEGFPEFEPEIKNALVAEFRAFTKSSNTHKE